MLHTPGFTTSWIESNGTTICHISPVHVTVCINFVNVDWIAKFLSLTNISGWIGYCCILLISFQSKGLSFLHDMNSSSVVILYLFCGLLSSFSAEDSTSPLSCFANFTHFFVYTADQDSFFNGVNFCNWNVVVYNYLIK